MWARRVIGSVTMVRRTVNWPVATGSYLMQEIHVKHYGREAPEATPKDISSDTPANVLPKLSIEELLARATDEQRESIRTFLSPPPLPAQRTDPSVRTRTLALCVNTFIGMVILEVMLTRR